MSILPSDINPSHNFDQVSICCISPQPKRCHSGVPVESQPLPREEVESEEDRNSTSTSEIPRSLVERNHVNQSIATERHSEEQLTDR